MGGEIDRDVITQRLFQVELPLALPEIMLGLNQVVVFALAMLIVSSLLGTHDLSKMHS